MATAWRIFTLSRRPLPQVNLFQAVGTAPLAKGPVDAAVGSALQSSFDRSPKAAYVLPGEEQCTLQRPNSPSAWRHRSHHSRERAVRSGPV